MHINKPECGEQPIDLNHIEDRVHDIDFAIQSVRLLLDDAAECEMEDGGLHLYAATMIVDQVIEITGNLLNSIEKARTIIVNGGS